MGVAVCWLHSFIRRLIVSDLGTVYFLLKRSLTGSFKRYSSIPDRLQNQRNSIALRTHYRLFV